MLSVNGTQAVTINAPINTTTTGAAITVGGSATLTLASISRSNTTTLAFTQNSSNLLQVTGNVSGGTGSALTFAGTGTGGITIGGTISPTTGGVTNNYTGTGGVGTLTINQLFLNGTTTSATFTNSAGSSAVNIGTYEGTTGTLLNSSVIGAVTVTTMNMNANRSISAALNTSITIKNLNAAGNVATMAANTGSITIGGSSGGTMTTSGGTGGITNSNTGTVTLQNITFAGSPLITQSAATGTLQMTGANVPSAAANVTVTYAGAGAAGANFTGLADGNGRTLAVSITSTSGTLTLSGTNTYSGGTTVGSSSTLQFNASTAIPNSGSVSNSGITALNFAFAQADLNKFASGSSGTITLTANSGNANMNLGSIGGGANLTAAYIGSTASVTYDGTITPNATAGYRLTALGAAVVFTHGGLLAGNAAMTINGNGGTGTVALTNINNKNNYIGLVTVNAGTLSIASDTVFSNSSAANALTLASSSTLTLSGTGGVTYNMIGGTTLSGNAIIQSTAATGTNVYNSNFTLGSNTLTIGGAKAITLGGAINGNGGLSITATNVNTTLNGNSGYIGGTVINNGASGITTVGNNNAFGTGTVAFNSAGTLSGSSITLPNNFTLTQTFTVTGNITFNGTIDLNGAGRNIAAASGQTITFGSTGGIIGSGQTATLNGAGTYNINGATTAGAVTISAASTVNVGTNSAFGGGTLTLSGGTTMSATGGARSFTNNVAISASPIFSGSNSLSFSGTLGIGTANRTITNNISGGTLTFSNTVSATSGSPQVTFDGATGASTLISGAINSTIGNVVIAGAATGQAVELGGNNSYTGTTTIGANGNSGIATLTLSGSNSLTGNIIFNNGRLNLNSAGAMTGVALLSIPTNNTASWTIGNTSGGSVTMTGNTPVDLAMASGKILTFNLANPLVFGTGVWTLSTAKTLDVTGSLTIGGLITPTSSFVTKSGAGTLTLTGGFTGDAGSGLIQNGGTTIVNTTPFTYTGDTTITSGTLKIGLNNTLRVTGGGSLVMNPGASATATFDLNGKDQTLNGLTATAGGIGSSTIIDNSSASASTLTVGGNSQSVTFGGPTGNYIIQNSGGGALSVVKAISNNNTATFTSAVTGTYTGVTQVTAGIFNIAGTLSGTSALLASYTSGLPSILTITGAVSGPSNIASTGGATITVSGPSLSTTSTATLSAAGSGGSVTISSPITSGAFSSISAGTGTTVSIGSTMAFASGATITGTGTGSVGLTGTYSTVSNVSTVSIAGGGTLNLANGDGTSFSNLSTLSLGVGSGTTNLMLDVGTDAASSDRLISSGAATTANTVRLNIIALTGFGNSPTYDLISATSGLDGGGASTFTLGAKPYGFSLSLTQSGSLVTLNVSGGSANTLYWHGGLSDKSWGALGGMSGIDTNWTINSDGSTNAQGTPGYLTTVVYSTSTNAQGASITSNLNGSYTIDSLQFTASPSGVTSVTLAPGTGGTLTIAPASSSDGISVAASAGNITISAPVELGANQTWAIDGTSPSSLTLSGAISGTGTITKSGSGNLTLSNSGNTFIGNITYGGGGTFTIAGDGSLGNSANSLTITANSTIKQTGTWTTSRTITVDTGVTALTLDTNGNNATFSNAVINNASYTLTKIGTGTLTMPGMANPLSGLVLGNNDSANTGSLVLTGGTLTVNGPVVLGNNAISSTTLQSGTSFVMNDPTSDFKLGLPTAGSTNAVIKFDASAASNVTINAANLIVGAFSSTASNYTGSTVTFTLPTGISSTSSITIAAGGKIQVGYDQNTAITTTFNLGGGITNAVYTPQIILGAQKALADMLINPTGSLTLQQTGTGGKTDVTVGYNPSTTTSTRPLSTFTLSTSGTVTATLGTLTLGDSVSTGTLGGNSVGGANGKFTLNASGSGSLVTADAVVYGEYHGISGGGTTGSFANNQFIISNGTFRFNSGGSGIGEGTGTPEFRGITVQVDTNGVLDMTSLPINPPVNATTNTSTLTLAGAGTIQNASSVGNFVTFNFTGGSFINSSVANQAIAMAVPQTSSSGNSLLRVDAGKSTAITGAYTVTGSISNTATARVDGTLTATGGISLASGGGSGRAILQGIGTVGSTLTVSGSGKVEPGNSGVGTLTLATTTFQSGSIFNFDLATAGTGSYFDYQFNHTSPTLGMSDSGSSKDLLTSSSTITFNPGSVVNISTITGHNFDPFKSYSWTIATNVSGTPTLGSVSNFSNFGTNYSDLGGSFSLTNSSSTLYLTYTAAPEPGTVGLFAAAGLGVFGLIRRRNRRPCGTLR